MAVVAAPRVPIAEAQSAALDAGLGQLTGLGQRRIAWFRGVVDGASAPIAVRAVQAGIDNGVPVVGILAGIGFDRDATLAQLTGLGQVARTFAAASGVVPTALVVDGPCWGSPAMLAGLVDVVVMTRATSAFINGAAASARIIGTDEVDEHSLGGAWAHHATSGLCDLLAEDLDDALDLMDTVLSFLPDNNLEPVPAVPPGDPVDRPAARAAAAVPADTALSYDVRDVIADVVDDEHFVELNAAHGPTVVVGLGRIAGTPVGVVANQPCQLAGALDIEGSVKAARFVRWCDSFNVPLVTFVDTPGFRPGRDQEWQGIIRHGAKMAFAYAEATVPRISVVLRKAYGGAYIVMDCKAMGNDCALAWPDAEIAVMGARGAIEILQRKALLALPESERDAFREQQEKEYAAEHLSPSKAAERGLIDAVIEPAATRRALTEAVTALVAKRERLVRRRHENIPL